MHNRCNMEIIIIDDDKLVCHALKTILESDSEITVAALGHDGTDAVSLYDQIEPDLVLMDIRMTTMTGIEAGTKILEKHKSAKILYLTTFADNEYIINALKIGAKGYLLKQNFESIIPAIKAVMSGQNVFGEEIVSKLPTMSSKNHEIYKEHDINEKELDIIIQVAEGLSNKEIAESLYLSEGTVRNYISTILEKLHLRDRTQLAIFYYKNN